MRNVNSIKFEINDDFSGFDFGGCDPAESIDVLLGMVTAAAEKHFGCDAICVYTARAQQGKHYVRIEWDAEPTEGERYDAELMANEVIADLVAGILEEQEWLVECDDETDEETDED